MKVLIWNDFSEFGNSVLPVECDNVIDVGESVVGGILIRMQHSNLCLPATVVIEIIKGETNE
jgi:hypothetical protein